MLLRRYGCVFLDPVFFFRRTQILISHHLFRLLSEIMNFKCDLMNYSFFEIIFYIVLYIRTLMTFHCFFFFKGMVRDITKRYSTFLEEVFVGVYKHDHDKNTEWKSRRDEITPWLPKCVKFVR